MFTPIVAHVEIDLCKGLIEVAFGCTVYKEDIDYMHNGPY